MNEYNSEYLNAFLKDFIYFNNFENIDEERFLALTKVAQNYKLQDISISDFFKLYANLKKDYKYDEFCLLLILIYDNKCLVFNKYLEMCGDRFGKLITKYKVGSQNNLHLHSENIKTAIRKKQFSQNIFGVYDEKIIEIERIFFNKYIVKDILSVSFETENFMKILNYELENITITKQRLEELKAMAHNWNEMYQLKNKRFVLANQLFSEYHYFGNLNDEEKLLMMVLAIDSNLDMLTIFYSCSNWREVDKNLILKFGFSRRKLINIEQMINDKFNLVPKDPWLLTLK